MKLFLVIAVCLAAVFGTSFAQLFGGNGNGNLGGNILADQQQAWARAAGGFFSDQQNLFARATGNLGLNGGGGNNPAGGLNFGGNLGGLFGGNSNGNPSRGSNVRPARP